MTALKQQYNQLLDASVSGHGFWIINHAEAVQELINAYIVRYGVTKTIAMLDDQTSELHKATYKTIEQHRNKQENFVAKFTALYGDYSEERDIQEAASC